MRLLLDVHHSSRAADALRSQGVDVTAAAESWLLRRLPDDELLRAATADGRAVVTEDVKDFGRIVREWAVSGEHHAGVMLTSPRRFHRGDPAYPHDLVRALAAFAAGDDPPAGATDWVRWLA